MLEASYVQEIAREITRVCLGICNKTTHFHAQSSKFSLLLYECNAAIARCFNRIFVIIITMIIAYKYFSRIVY